MDANWQRWVEVSIIKYFTDNAVAIGIPIFVEGFPRSTDTLKDWFELRMDGIYFSSGSQDEWKAEITVNVLVNSVLDQKDTYRHSKNIGAMTKAFAATIPIYKLGVGPDDDPSDLLACMKLVNDKHGLVVSKFGQVKPETELLRSTIEGNFRTYLNG